MLQIEANSIQLSNEFYILLLVLYLQSSLLLTVSSSDYKDYLIANPGCPDRCGNISVPYPFGIGANCYHNASYEIVCNSSSHPPRAFLQRYSLEVMRITGGYVNYDRFGGQLITVRIPIAGNMCTSDGKGIPSIDLRGSPYQFSIQENNFMVQGCSGSVVFKNGRGQIVSGCASVCAQNSSISAAIHNISITKNCYGVGCCKALLSSGLDYYEIFFDQRASPGSSSTCKLAATLIQTDASWELENRSTVTVVLDWQAALGVPHRRVRCNNYQETHIYGCRCINDIYVGNPYLLNGCVVVKECQKCKNRCRSNLADQYYCEKNSFLKRPSVYGFSSGAGLMLLILGCYWMYRLVKWRRDVKRKAENFKRNGGLLLQQQLSSDDGIVEQVTVFTTADLEKATDSFHESRILGRGGQGIVFKGMLMDGRIVAIKKSMKVDEDQLGQFINEMVILSQINHRNVVKLLGFCLETEVPLIVYEFVPNGTLYEHIHDPTEEFHVTWKMRLQIAAESAGAIAYLHSATYSPVYHRDIKSSNILLDDKFRAKVSDFGTSRLVNIEQTHVTTRVQGTYGYLDPEFFQSNQFTEKSDVYSFGVVLAELITRKKPINRTESGGLKTLATEFLSQMENSHLFEFIDARIVEEAKEDELVAVANLARKCLNINGRLRPTMKQVERTLDGIKSLNSKQQISNIDNGRCIVTEIDDSDPFTTDTFFSASDSLSSSAMEVLPLTSNL